MAVNDKVKERLKANGVWKSFCARREEHKAAGDLPRDAQRKALIEFGGPDGGSKPSAAVVPPENQQVAACSTVEL